MFYFPSFTRFKNTLKIYNFKAEVSVGKVEQKKEYFENIFPSEKYIKKKLYLVNTEIV